MDFWQALTGWAEQRPHHLAVCSSNSELTYDELAGRAQTLALALKTTTQQRIGILTNEPVTMAIGFHGAALAGKTLVILDPAWPKDLLRSMLTMLNCATVISDSDEALSTEPQITQRSVPRDSAPQPWSAPLHQPEHELLIICTSGSTSRPKAVLRTVDSWQQSLATGATILGAEPSSITLSPGPISHGLGLYSLIESIHTGGTFVGSGRWEPEKIRQLLQQHQCNRLVSVPTIISRLIDAPLVPLLGDLRFAVSGGEFMPQDLVGRLYHLPSFERCVEYFGSSEHSLIAYTERRPKQRSSKNFTGRLFPGVDVHLHSIDPVSGVGKVYVDSAFNAAGYVRQTAAPISRCHGATSISDLGKILPDGQITFIRRDDGMLNLHGNNIHPREIKQVFVDYGLTDIRIQLEETTDGSRLAAYTCATAFNHEELRILLHRQLPPYKIPHVLYAMSTWPPTFSGKSTGSRIPSNATEILERIQLR